MFSAQQSQTDDPTALLESSQNQLFGGLLVASFVLSIAFSLWVTYSEYHIHRQARSMSLAPTVSSLLALDREFDELTRVIFPNSGKDVIRKRQFINDIQRLQGRTLKLDSTLAAESFVTFAPAASAVVAATEIELMHYDHPFESPSPAATHEDFTIA